MLSFRIFMHDIDLVVFKKHQVHVRVHECYQVASLGYHVQVNVQVKMNRIFVVIDQLFEVYTYFLIIFYCICK